MEFKFEREMTEVVRRWLAGQGLAVKVEFQMPWGICDLVGAEFDPANVERRLEYGQRATIGSALRAALLLKMPEHKSGRSISMQRLAEKFRFGSANDQIEREINCLIDRRFVVRTRSGGLQKVNGWYPLHRRVVAVELKLTKIEEVLRQAAHHTVFATESYIGLPLPVAERLLSRKSCATLANGQLGVLGITREGCTVLKQPALSEAAPDPVIQMHLAERFWPAHLKTVKH